MMRDFSLQRALLELRLAMQMAGPALKAVYVLHRPVVLPDSADWLQRTTDFLKTHPKLVDVAFIGGFRAPVLRFDTDVLDTFYKFRQRKGAVVRFRDFGIVGRVEIAFEKLALLRQDTVALLDLTDCTGATLTEDDDDYDEDEQDAQEDDAAAFVSAVDAFNRETIRRHNLSQRPFEMRLPARRAFAEAETEELAVPPLRGKCAMCVWCAKCGKIKQRCAECGSP